MTDVTEVHSLSQLSSLALPRPSHHKAVEPPAIAGLIQTERKNAMRAYKVVDAFSAVPFKGNPVAVVLDGQGLSDAEMQAIAGWTNLSETTFVLPATDPNADYCLRIFTPRSELAFAGHPTLGSAHALLEAGLFTPRGGLLVQECKKGLIRISVAGSGPGHRLTLDLPSAELCRLSEADADELEVILGAPLDQTAPPTIVDVGAVWAIARLESAEAVLDLTPDFARAIKFEERLGLTGITVFGPKDGDADGAIEVRTFAPSSGIEEDPVCGSGNGSIAAFRHAYDARFVSGGSYVATQGRKVGRDGRIEVGISAEGSVTVGGECVTGIEGMMACD